MPRPQEEPFGGTCIFAAMAELSGDPPARAGSILSILPWKCIEFQLAQGQSINAPLFTLFQVVSGKQAAK